MTKACILTKVTTITKVVYKQAERESTSENKRLFLHGFGSNFKAQKLAHHSLLPGDPVHMIETGQHL